MDIGKLFELQKLDVNLERARRKLAQLKQALGESEELGGARKTVADTEAELHRWHAAQKNAELESQTLAQQIDAKDKELMSGRVSHPKELESLQANVESLRRQRSSIEDTGMDALLHVETLNQQLATAQESLRQIEEKWNGSQAELLQEDAKYKRIYAQLKQQRDTIAQSLAPCRPQVLRRLAHTQGRCCGFSPAKRPVRRMPYRGTYRRSVGGALAQG